ncbi:LuxR C-terminal-related transcriptional regulator, partial [Mycobacterium sp. 1423905.2]|uniref:helix-turn-helix transcriptional regulator n=1 Tax=Mycobacterium sp. 1423905.2 TaxID=1856859 RepID=UPI0008015287
IAEALTDNRLVTLTGAGGAGKTRLAVQVAANRATDFADGVWYVDLAPITDPDVVPVTASRALGLLDQPGQPTMNVLVRFLRDRHTLLLLDNCEHLLDASAQLITDLLGTCPTLTLLATSREPIGVPGEVSWRVPSLSLTDEAIELFSDRARRAKPDFRITGDHLATVTEICRRLDGLPLAIELAAARIRALSPREILDSLHDAFRLLTGGARTAVRRQQTLRASVDWSHAMLSDPEQVLFRRLAVFLGGFDLDAARAVACGAETQRYQVLDQLSLLVDKSLLIAEDTPSGTRYRLLETVRQYAIEKLAESREGNDIRCRHRDHYTAMAALLDAPAAADYRQRIERAEVEIDNLRAAFAWSQESSDSDQALRLASALQPLWLTRGRIQEGLGWLDAALAGTNIDSAGVSEIQVRASANKAMLLSALGRADLFNDAEQILAMARELGDRGLVARALTASGMMGAPYNPPLARQYFTEAAGIARDLNDLWWLGQVRAWESISGLIVGEPIAALQSAADEGRRIADSIGDSFVSRQCRFVLGWVRIFYSDIHGAATGFGTLIEECGADHDPMSSMYISVVQAFVLAYAGDTDGAKASADSARRHASELFEYYQGAVDAAFGIAHLAAGEASSAWAAYEAARERTNLDPQISSIFSWAPLGPLACGDVAAARRWADDVVGATKGGGQSLALACRARVRIAEGDLDAAERDAYDALDLADRIGGDLVVSYALDCLAMAAAGEGNRAFAARLFGAADAARRRTGVVRFKVLDAGNDAELAGLRNTMEDNEFDAAWAEGAALSTQDAVAYARRGRGERKRGGSGWPSLTRTELEIVRLVSEGLGNKDVAARMFVSPRTVQAHLTHIYAKLGLTSRVQLAQEAARH